MKKGNVSMGWFVLAFVGFVGSASAQAPVSSCDGIEFPGGSMACKDYIGANWDPGTAGTDCGAVLGALGPGNLVVGSLCDTTQAVGTCLGNGSSADETQLHFYNGPVDMLQNNCESLLGGEWVVPIAGRCAHEMVFGPPGTPAMPVCTQYEGDNWELGTAAVDHCSVQSNGVFANSERCTATEIGFCTIGEGTLDAYSIYFYMGDAAQLQVGCQTAPPYGFGGVFTAVEPPPSLDQAVLDALASDASITVTPDSCVDDECLAGLFGTGDYLTFAPADGSATTGLIIYPGAMVEPRTYAVAARAIAAYGYFVALVPFPNMLPITDAFKANDVIDDHPEIIDWAIAGHSMGGAAASIFAFVTKQIPGNKLEGIAFWASYPAPATQNTPPAVLTGTGLKGVSVIGSLDSVLNWNNFDATKAFLPAGTHIAEIRGGNHAQFGYYGDQDGDTPATISTELQHELFVGATVHMLNRIGVPALEDVLNPLYQAIEDNNEDICIRAQRRIAGFKGRDLLPHDIDNELFWMESAFQSSKPSFTGGDSKVSITSHVHQNANPFDITAPPILDGEVWCKMKSQDAIAAQYSITPNRNQGSCAHANHQVFEDALHLVMPETIPDMTFVDDFYTSSGPEWLGGPVELIDMGSSYTMQGARLEVPVFVPPPYGGNFYCKLWSPTAAVKFLINTMAAN